MDDKDCGMPKEKHVDDHEWIGVLRDRENRKVELWLKVKESTLSSLITSAVIGLGTLVWWAISSALGI